MSVSFPKHGEKTPPSESETAQTSHSTSAFSAQTECRQNPPTRKRCNSTQRQAAVNAMKTHMRMEQKRMAVRLSNSPCLQSSPTPLLVSSAQSHPPSHEKEEERDYFVHNFATVHRTVGEKAESAKRRPTPEDVWDDHTASETPINSCLPAMHSPLQLPSMAVPQRCTDTTLPAQCDPKRWKLDDDVDHLDKSADTTRGVEKVEKGEDCVGRQVPLCALNSYSRRVMEEEPHICVKREEEKEVDDIKEDHNRNEDEDVATSQMGNASSFFSHQTEDLFHPRSSRMCRRHLDHTVSLSITLPTTPPNPSSPSLSMGSHGSGEPPLCEGLSQSNPTSSTRHPAPLGGCGEVERVDAHFASASLWTSLPQQDASFRDAFLKSVHHSTSGATHPLHAWRPVGSGASHPSGSLGSVEKESARASKSAIPRFFTQQDMLQEHPERFQVCGNRPIHHSVPLKGGNGGGNGDMNTSACVSSALAKARLGGWAFSARGCRALSCFEAVEVLPGLFLGSYSDACNMDALVACGISIVLNITEECPLTEEMCHNVNHIRFMQFPLRDHSDENITRYFRPLTRMIHKQLHRRHLALQTRRLNNASNEVPFSPTLCTSGEGGVLVHCRMGVSRSATIILAYIMMYGTDITGESCRRTEFDCAVSNANSPMLSAGPALGRPARCAEDWDGRNGGNRGTPSPVWRCGSCCCCVAWWNRDRTQEVETGERPMVVMSYRSAFELVKQRKADINPNIGFVLSLRELDGASLSPY